MGCVSSKQEPCRQCRSPYSSATVLRSRSMPVHHPARHKGDSYHVVALTSTTLGSLKLDPTPQPHSGSDSGNHSGSHHSSNKVIPNGFLEKDPKTQKGNLDQADKEDKEENEEEEYNNGGNEQGKTEEIKQSDLLCSNEKYPNPNIIPKTPNRKSLGEAETINTWELMEDLEESISTITPPRSPVHPQRFSFDIIKSAPRIPFDPPQSRTQVSIPQENPKPISLNNDSNSISTFSNSPQHNQEQSPVYHASPPETEEKLNTAEEKVNTAEEKVNTTEEKVSTVSVPDKKTSEKEEVIFYFTSLRGVRKTYEDCSMVKVILKSLNVRVDERDVSMHSGFRDELVDLMGGSRSSATGLPKVFIGKKYIGGAEEVKQMNEDRELEKLVAGCKMVDDGKGGCSNGGCEACGDIRFLPCETCSGSCKVYYEEEEETEFGFKRCPDCNENGLIRCPICCN